MTAQQWTGGGKGRGPAVERGGGGAAPPPRPPLLMSHIHGHFAESIV